MYKVLIADDEYLAQAHLHHIINWESYGYEIAAICENGKAASEFLKNNHADVVFTDVCMPIMDGIELTRHIKAHYPNIKVIITSSYSDLDYVKEAFRANAFDYILKHTINEESIVKILKKLSKDLENTTTSNLPQAENYFFDTKHSADYKENIINIIQGKTISEDIYNAVIAAGSIHNYSIVKQTHSQEDLKILFDNIINTMSYALKDINGFVIYLHSENQFVLFLPFSEKVSEPEVMNLLFTHIQRINYSMKKFFNLNFLWGVSNLSKPGYGLSKCLKSAFEMLITNPIIDKNRPVKTNRSASISINTERELLTAISSLDSERINQCLEDLFLSDTSNGLTVKLLLGELLTFANRICVDYSIDINEIFESFDDNNSRVINSIKTPEEGLKYSKNLFKALLESYKKKAFPSRNSRYVSNVKDFIEKHYAEDISLEEIASFVGLSVSHLSSVFKSETGQNVISYLTNYRIEKAKQLLIQNTDIKHVYSLVGFNNYNYFFVIFKRHVGCTPSEYRKKYSSYNNLQ